MIVAYDLEQFQNFHSCFAVDIDSGDEYYFEISDFQDDSVAYFNWLEKQQGMIGFNNLHYDYPMIEAFIKLYNKGLYGGELARALYKEGQKIIKDKWGFPYWKIRIPQLDLFKIHHFDNMAKITSLKDLQVAMGWHNVQDLPFKFDHHVSNDEREAIKHYNKNDVYSTLKFYRESESEITLRKTLKKKYGINCLNWNDPKIGEQIFLTKLAEKKQIPKRVLKKQRTNRSEIDLSECILPYNIQNKEIQDFVDDLSQRVIEKTKGSINHRIVFEGMPYDFGTGGIHGCKRSKVWKRSENYLIMTSDVSSYYPNLSIQNGFYPEHLGYDFVIVYEDMYDTRVEAKYADPKTEDTIATDKGLKLGLNGVYGKSNDKYSFLYDPKYTMITTINGQIQLSDLSITLQKAGFEAIMINTDGFEFVVHKDRVEEYKAICDKWMEETKLILEHDQYQTLAIRDVNNYVAQTVDGEIKHKGAFEIDKDWHKDPSFKIIPIALQNYFIFGEPVEKTIKEHDDILDFCGRVKSNSGYKIKYHYLDGNEEKTDDLQKTNRVYLSNSGGYLYKSKGDRTYAIYKGQKTTVFNKFRERDDYDINYNWYIKEVRKIIDIIEPKQLSFL